MGASVWSVLFHNVFCMSTCYGWFSNDNAFRLEPIFFFISNLFLHCLTANEVTFCSMVRLKPLRSILILILFRRLRDVTRWMTIFEPIPTCLNLSLHFPACSCSTGPCLFETNEWILSVDIRSPVSRESFSHSYLHRRRRLRYRVFDQLD